MGQDFQDQEVFKGFSEELERMACPKCDGKMRIIAFITDFSVSKGSSTILS
jgi:hypothetical protein